MSAGSAKEHQTTCVPHKFTHLDKLQLEYLLCQTLWDGQQTLPHVASRWNNRYRGHSWEPSRRYWLDPDLVCVCGQQALLEEMDSSDHSPIHCALARQPVQPRSAVAQFRVACSWFAVLRDRDRSWQSFTSALGSLKDPVFLPAAQYLLGWHLKISGVLCILLVIFVRIYYFRHKKCA